LLRKSDQPEDGSQLQPKHVVSLKEEYILIKKTLNKLLNKLCLTSFYPYIL